MTQEQRFQIRAVIECLRPGSRRIFFEQAARDRFTDEERVLAHCLIDALDEWDNINPKEICVEAVQYATGIDILEHRTCRERKLVDARRIYFALRLRMNTRGAKPDTVSKIGRELGKDHATVLHAKRAHIALIDTDTQYRKMYEVASDYVSHKMNGTVIPEQNEDRQDDSAAC